MGLPPTAMSPSSGCWCWASSVCPFPDEFLLTGCGFLIYQGHLHPIPAFASALAGSMCGITCSYLIGRTLGWKFLHSRAGRLLHIRDEQIRWVHDWFNRIGHWALMIGYFVPGVRHFTAIVAGHLEAGISGLRVFCLQRCTIVGEHIFVPGLSFRLALGRHSAAGGAQFERGFDDRGGGPSCVRRLCLGATKTARAY